MFFKSKDDGLLEHRVAQLEKEVEGLNNRFAIKLVERIVFAVCGAILMGVIASLTGGGLPWIG